MSSDLRTPTKPTHAANPGSTRNDDALVRPTVSLPPTPQEKVEPARPSTHEATQVTEVGSGSFPLSRSGSGTGALQYSTSSRSNVKLQILSTFGLDQAEVLLDEFRCFNFRSKVPIQGRLYITQFHVCFYSNLLNLEHKLVIRAKDILNISRRDDRAIVLELAPTAGRKQTEEHFLFSNRRTREGAADFLELLDISKEKVSHSTIEHNNDAHGHGGEKHETDTGDTSSQKSSVSDGTGAETSQPQEGDSDIVGLCPMNPPEGAAIATTLPSTIKSQFEKLPLILEFSLRNTTTTDIFRLFYSDDSKFGFREWGALTQEYEHQSGAEWTHSTIPDNDGNEFCLKRVIVNKRKIPKNPIASSDHVDITTTQHLFAFGDANQPSLFLHSSALSEGVLFSNHFTSEIRWMFKHLGPKTVSLEVRGDLVFSKPVNFLVKPIIVKTTRANMAQTIGVWTTEAPKIIAANQPRAPPISVVSSSNVPGVLSSEVTEQIKALTDRIASLEAQARQFAEEQEGSVGTWQSQLKSAPWEVIGKIFVVAFALLLLYRVDQGVTALQAYIKGMQHSCPLE